MLKLDINKVKSIMVYNLIAVMVVGCSTVNNTTNNSVVKLAENKPIENKKIEPKTLTFSSKAVISNANTTVNLPSGTANEFTLKSNKYLINTKLEIFSL